MDVRGPLGGVALLDPVFFYRVTCRPERVDNRYAMKFMDCLNPDDDKMTNGARHDDHIVVGTDKKVVNQLEKGTSSRS